VSSWSEKAAVVTGAGSGIGYAIGLALADAGATVALNDIDADVAVRGAAAINARVGRTAVHAYGCDIADVAAVQRMVGEFGAQTGRLDVLIANAGITNYGDFLTYSPEAFDRLCAVNLRGSFFSAQAAARVMIEEGIPGRIVLMSSVTGRRAFLNLGAYGITKAGIRHMARSLALELGQYNITVNALSPGATLTERTAQDDPGFEANWAGVTPTGRAGYPQDVVSAALFLASPEARQITGQTIEVDGGWSLASPLPAAHSQQPDYSSELR
jgi:glucose 1-dehydrogenase